MPDWRCSASRSLPLARRSTWDGAAAKARIFSWAGWMDGGTVDGALALYSSFTNPVRLVIGPWSHGGGEHTDPFLPDAAPTEPSSPEQHRMLMDFMDHYVRHEATDPGEGVGEIRYWTFNEGWKTTPSWPPEGFEATRWYFGPDGSLNRNPPDAAAASDEYAVDFSHTTGNATRWHTQLGGGDVVYGDRSEADATLLTYTSEPVDNEVEITGLLGNGEIDLGIEIVGHRRNSHGPLHHADREPYWVGPTQFTTKRDLWSKEYQLVECGLLKKPILVHKHWDG